MLYFLVAQSRSSVFSSEEVAFLRRAAGASLPPGGFRLVDSLLSERRRTAIFIWSNESPKAARTAYAQVNDRLLLIAGQWSSPRGHDLYELLAMYAMHGASPTVTDEISGTWACAFVDLSADRIVLINSLSGLEPVFYGETHESFVASNRAMSVASALGRGAPQLNPRVVPHVLTVSYLMTNETPFLGVAALRNNATLTKAWGMVPQMTDMDDSLAHPAQRSPVAPHAKFSCEDASFYDELTDRFLGAVSALRSHPQPLRVGLSGGKDSRLLAAGLKAADIEFETLTTGWPSDPDVPLAQRVAEALGVPNQHIAPAPGAERVRVLADPYGKVSADWLLTDGHVLDLPLLPPPPPILPSFQPGTVVSGVGGELHRGGFGIVNYAWWSPGDVMSETLTRRVLDRILFVNPYDMIRSGPFAEYADPLRAWVEDRIREYGHMEVMDDLYLYFRSCRFHSEVMARSRISRQLTMPLADHRFLSWSRRLTTDDRRRDAVHYEILRRLHAPLTEIPLKASRWGFEYDEPVSGDLAGWRSREPVVAPADDVSRSYFYYDCGGEIKDLLYDVVFRNHAVEPLFELVDRQALLRQFTGQDIFKPTASFWFYKVFASAVLLSGAWCCSPPATRPVEVSKGVAWHRQLDGFFTEVAKVLRRYILLGQTLEPSLPEVPTFTPGKFSRRVPVVRCDPTGRAIDGPQTWSFKGVAPSDTETLPHGRGWAVRREEAPNNGWHAVMVPLRAFGPSSGARIVGALGAEEAFTGTIYVYLLSPDGDRQLLSDALVHLGRPSRPAFLEFDPGEDVPEGPAATQAAIEVWLPLGNKSNIVTFEDVLIDQEIVTLRVPRRRNVWRRLARRRELATPGTELGAALISSAARETEVELDKMCERAALGTEDVAWLRAKLQSAAAEAHARNSNQLHALRERSQKPLVREALLALREQYEKRLLLRLSRSSIDDS